MSKRIYSIVSIDIDKILVTVNVNSTLPTEIEKERFNQWLIDNNRLEWVNDTSNERGEHHQQTGVLTLDQYYELPEVYLKSDMYDYLTHITKTGKLSNLPAIAQSLKDLL